MNIIDSTIETLRERWFTYARDCNTEQSQDYRDGFRTGLRQAAIDLERVLRGLSTFNGYDLPHPKDCESPVWCIPLRWRDESFLLERASATMIPLQFSPRLELQRLEVARGQWSWLVRPAVWTP